MSLSAERHQKHAQRRCACGDRALFWSNVRRRFRRRADHPLCQRCWRALFSAAVRAATPSLGMEVR